MHKLKHWLSQQLSQEDFGLEPLQGDASFRRYYRLNMSNKNYIAVDAPPETENSKAFVSISQAFGEMGLYVPKVLAHDLERGFLLLTDLGDDVLFQVLNEKRKKNNINQIDSYYRKSFAELAKIQQCKIDLPHFDYSFMSNELNLFQTWFLEKHLKLDLSHSKPDAKSKSIQKILKNSFEILLESAVSQPQCCIHRDYHSRNLMCLDDDQIGVLDFQDAMIGPVTYDLVSLIRDCYIDWPLEQVNNWAEDFYAQYLSNMISSKAEFMRYFDLMGIQRHLKAIFIFARKFHRDNVDGYLKDIPRALKYVIDVSQNYPELAEFRAMMSDIEQQRY